MDRTSSQPPAAPPLVSVVVPTCNRRDILERCVEALVGQTHPNYEIIIVDDGSTDDTPRFMERFIADRPDRTIRYLRNASNLGANPSRNRGVREARGTLVAFEDSDCIAEPDWLEKLTAPFSRDRVGAVVGLVVDPKPTNIYELTFKGTHRVVGPRARRLVGGNMCVRRDLLMDHALDEDRATRATHADGTIDVTVAGRGDEEGLYLMLRAAGFEQWTAPDAVVLHEHHYTARSFFKQAFRGGRSAARLVYKYRLWPRVDMLPFMLAYVTLPLVFIHRWLAVVPVFFFVGAMGAITYNDLFRKGKTPWETVLTFPVLLAYYHVRLAGYVMEALQLRLHLHLHLGEPNVTRQRLTPPRTANGTNGTDPRTPFRE